VLLLAAAALITAVAWLYLIHMAGMRQGHVHSGMAPAFWALFGMWAAMMVAMMLPAVMPYVLVFHAEQARRRARNAVPVPEAFFLGGYFVMWMAFSAFCAGLQELLHRRALLSPMMSASSSVLAGGILIAAGVYQWTPLKNACLKHCRTPLTFLLTDWREGAAGAFRMGVDHGYYCLACCWMLMLIPFAAGVMNLVWMAGITVLLLLEKAAPGGELTARISGGVFVAAGAYVIGTGAGF
jgi:predicted metal-binding membrane protein